MRTIVKTGAVLKIFGHEHELTTPQLYGDVHVTGSCAIVCFPKRAHRGWKEHGTINVSGRYFLRFHDRADSVLVIPARQIQWKTDALHPEDLALWEITLRL